MLCSIFVQCHSTTLAHFKIFIAFHHTNTNTNSWKLNSHFLCNESSAIWIQNSELLPLPLTPPPCFEGVRGPLVQTRPLVWLCRITLSIKSLVMCFNITWQKNTWQLFLDHCSIYDLNSQLKDFCFLISLKMFCPNDQKT